MFFINEKNKFCLNFKNDSYLTNLINSSHFTCFYGYVSSLKEYMQQQIRIIHVHDKGSQPPFQTNIKYVNHVYTEENKCIRFKKSIRFIYFKKKRRT